MTNLDFSLLEKIATSLPGVIFQILQKQNNSLIISASSGCHELCELQLEVIQNDFNILLNLLRSQDIHTFTELVTVSSVTLAPWCWQGEILTLSSKIKWVQISVHPQKQANGDILWEGLVMDITTHKLTEENLRKNITKSKQAESQLHKLNTNLERQVEERTAQLQEKVQEIQELSRIKDVMLHTVSHDLRTSVMGNLMVLNNLIREQVGNRERQTGDSPIAQSIVERMIQGNERQLGMIDSLLEINSSDTKALIMNQEVVQFSTLIKAIVQDIASLLNKYQAKLDNSIGENFPTVKADQELLRKLFVTLLTYTCQNNPPGLNIILKARVEAGKIRCTIQDDGIEISKIECDRFFDLHIREPQSRSSTCTSLKLYMCRQIIKAHGGEISVISNRKRGLTILFTLPVTAELKKLYTL